MQVPAAAALVAAPGGTPEAATQLFGGPVVGPDVPVGMLPEPGVLDRGVRRDEVEEDPDAERVGARDELVEVGERPYSGATAV